MSVAKKNWDEVNSLVFAIVCFLGICLSACSHGSSDNTSQQGILQKSDFVGSNLSLGMDYNAVLNAAGTPEKTTHPTYLDNTSRTLTLFWYNGYQVLIDSSNVVRAIRVFASGISTSRGFMVGDSLSKVRELLGPPFAEGSDPWLDKDLRILSYVSDLGTTDDTYHMMLMTKDSLVNDIIIMGEAGTYQVYFY